MTDRARDVTTPNPPDAGSGEALAAPFPEPAPISTDPSRNAKVRLGDRIFRWLAEGSGILIVVIIAAIGVFLLWRAIPALARNEENFFLYGGNWVTTDTSAMQFGILDLLQVTVFVSVFALVLAMPVALGIAIFLTQYAPRRVAGPLAYMVDLLAAVPSIIYGVWGLYVLAPVIKPFAVWLNENLGWLFLFATGNASVAGGGTIFTAGIVLAVMILPIITAVTREVFVQTPRGQIEAALALGATRWEVVRTTVLPFGLSGYISGAMLGLGRALGETIALLIILRGTQTGVRMVAVRRAATRSPARSPLPHAEFNDQYKAGAYIAAGLVLFILTFVVNSLARAAVAGKDRSAHDVDTGPAGQGADIPGRQPAPQGRPTTSRPCW